MAEFKGWQVQRFQSAAIVDLGRTPRLLSLRRSMRQDGRVSRRSASPSRARGRPYGHSAAGARELGSWSWIWNSKSQWTRRPLRARAWETSRSRASDSPSPGERMGEPHAANAAAGGRRPVPQTGRSQDYYPLRLLIGEWFSPEDRKEHQSHMGVGYCVSPLHRITYFDTSAMTMRPPVKGSDSPIDQIAEATGASVGVGVPRLYSPAIKEILAWRQGVATKYRDQLEEQLTWDEDTTFEVSEEVATSSDVMFRYVAAILDQRGTSELNKLLDITEPPRHEYQAVFAEADRRGFGGRFPHLLLGANLWLPFRSQLMIEEPNWNGKLDRYGSVFHLVDEITTVRAAIADADPLIIHSSADQTSDQVIVAAWQTSNKILRLATIAAAKHLPLWTTG
jgi:hypothetical protein